MRINSVPDVKCFCKNENVLCVQSMVCHFVQSPCTFFISPFFQTIYPLLSDLWFLLSFILHFFTLLHLFFFISLTRCVSLIVGFWIFPQYQKFSIHNWAPLISICQLHTLILSQMPNLWHPCLTKLSLFFSPQLLHFSAMSQLSHQPASQRRFKSPVHVGFVVRNVSSVR